MGGGRFKGERQQSNLFWVGKVVLNNNIVWRGKWRVKLRKKKKEQYVVAIMFFFVFDVINCIWGSPFKTWNKKLGYFGSLMVCKNPVSWCLVGKVYREKHIKVNFRQKMPNKLYCLLMITCSLLVNGGLSLVWYYLSCMRYCCDFSKYITLHIFDRKMH